MKLAHAGSFYVDAGGGVAKMQSLDAFGPGDSSTSMGYNLNSSLFVNFSSGGPIELQLGLVQDYASANGSTTGNSLSLLTVYPALRLQITRLYFTGGYTPWVWQSQGSGTSASAARAVGSSSVLAEAGLLWPITPEFSLGAFGNAQFVKNPDGNGPSPAMSAGVLMRFHFGYYGDNSGGGHKSNEYDGFRYPFGFMRN
ncbi:MAG: hypothetical protein P4M08_04375 [Oligoflexia bacterium]|nr:hypothetical protein [Oligoflexia bacterium]